MKKQNKKEKRKLNIQNLNVKVYSALKFELMKMIVDSDKVKDDTLSIYKDDEDNIQDVKLTGETISWIDTIYAFLKLFYKNSIEKGYLKELNLCITEFLTNTNQLKDIYIQYLLKKFSRKLDFQFIFDIVQKSFLSLKDEIEDANVSKNIDTAEISKFNWINSAHSLLLKTQNGRMNKVDLLLFLIIIIVINDNVNNLSKGGKINV